MFLKIIDKSEASYLCCYQKRSYTESTGRSASPQHLRPKISVSEIMVEGFKIEQSRTK